MYIYVYVCFLYIYWSLVGEPNGKYSVRGVCVWTREKSGGGRGVWGCVPIFFFFPSKSAGRGRGPGGRVRGQLCLPSVVEKKISSRADIFGHQRWKFFFFPHILCVFLFRSRRSVVNSTKVCMSSCPQWKCPRPVVSAFRCGKK